MATAAQTDVVVIGGGVAGLTAALQLKQLRPATEITVLEKRGHPVPPTAYKVGESIADVASHYLEDIIGLGDYLEREHLRKMGLRWFCPANGNRDIARRVEFGLIRFSPIRTFHVDRGAIENHLAQLVADSGVQFRAAATVSRADFAEDCNTVSFTRDGKPQTIQARWVVDASGRQALLRRQLGSGVQLPGDAGACWFRVPGHLTIDDWSDDPAWRAQVASGARWRSTVSFVGQGYWIWVINLRSGAASVGVVADPDYVPWERIRRYDALREWLGEVEPQLADHLPAREEQLLDFMKRKDFSHSCTRAFSLRRWALTGEAAVFLDPLYSTGHDTTAIANTLLTDLIRRDLDGEDRSALSRRLRSHNRVLLGFVRLALDVFPKQLAVYGQPQATGCKFMWDNASYFGVLLSLFRRGAILDPDFMRRLQPIVVRNAELNSFMQTRFREWGTSGKDFRQAGIPTVSDFFFEHLFTRPLQPMSPEELYEDVSLSVARLESIAHEMVSRMSAAVGEAPPAAPYRTDGHGQEELMLWSDYEQRTGPPSERAPQPAHGWGIR